MHRPPKRVVAVALVLMASGIRGVYEFVPLSNPVGLVLHILWDAFVILVGISLLFGIEWARLVALALNWIGFIGGCVCVLALSLNAIVKETLASLIGLATILIATCGCGAVIWALRSQKTRTWTGRTDLVQPLTGIDGWRGSLKR